MWLAATQPVVERVQLDDRCWVDVVRGLVPDGDRVHADLSRDASWRSGRTSRRGEPDTDPKSRDPRVFTRRSGR